MTNVKVATSAETEQLVDKIKQNDVGEKLVDNGSSSILPTNSSRKVKVWGLTNITIAEANRLSQPLPGPELLGLVAEAKNKFQLPKNVDDSVCRYINGKWFAPQPCHQ